MPLSLSLSVHKVITINVLFLIYIYLKDLGEKEKGKQELPECLEFLLVFAHSSFFVFFFS